MDVSDYWKNQKITNTIVNNSPNEYASVDENRGLNITDAFKKINLSTKATILEFGCNVGRNLNFLYKNDFKNLTGVEICNAAIGLGKKKYEQLFNLPTFNIFNERCSDFIKNNNNNAYDVVYTMAVLMHIDNPEREIIYNFLKKNVKYAIFIEPINFPRKIIRDNRLFNIFDYELHMKKRGFITISKTRSLGDLAENYNTIIFKNTNLNQSNQEK
jgi:2-polyprenyl-3-methyl-5-hydroxy-6-metoxy-1,4-benzoquinol methylase